MNAKAIVEPSESGRRAPALRISTQIIVGLLILAGGYLVRKYRIEHEALAPPAHAVAPALTDHSLTRDAVPSALLVSPRARYAFVVLHPGASSADLTALVGRAGQQVAPDIAYLGDVHGPPSSGAMAHAELRPIDLGAFAAAPSVAKSRHGADVAKVLSGQGQALSIEFDVPSADAVSRLRQAVTWTGLVADACGCAVVDAATDEVYTAAAFHSDVSDVSAGPTLDVRAHVTVRYTRGQGVWRASTRGLSKLGLPDLVLERAPADMPRHIDALFELVGQTLLEKRALDADGRVNAAITHVQNDGVRAHLRSRMGLGATGALTVRLFVGAKREGDPARLAEMVLGDGADSDEAGAGTVLRQAFGSDAR